MKSDRRGADSMRFSQKQLLIKTNFYGHLAAKQPIKFVILTLGRCIGDVLEQRTYFSKQLCLKACQENSQCSSFSYDSIINVCVLYKLCAKVDGSQTTFRSGLWICPTTIQNSEYPRILCKFCLHMLSIFFDGSILIFIDGSILSMRLFHQFRRFDLSR